MAEAEQLDRRTTDTAMLELIRTIQQDVTEMRLELNNHIQTEPKEWAIVLGNLMKASFPNGDADGHRRFHEANIKAAEERAVFWADLRRSVTKWGVFGFLGWILLRLGDGFLAWLQHAVHVK